MRLQSDRRRLALDGLAIAAATAALWYVLGPIGLGVGGAVAVTLVLVSPVYAFAVGQFLFALLGATLYDAVPSTGVLVGQAGLAALLVAALLDRWPRRSAAVAVGVFAVAAVGFGAAAALEPLWHGVVVVGVIYAVLAYTLHRYELVTLDLVGEADR